MSLGQEHVYNLEVDSILHSHRYYRKQTVVNNLYKPPVEVQKLRTTEGPTEMSRQQASVRDPKCRSRLSWWVVLL